MLACVCTACQKILERLNWIPCLQQSLCYQISYHHPMKAAGLVHTSPNQRPCEGEAPACKSVLFPTSPPILFGVWGREGELAAWLTSSLRQQTLPHILRKQRSTTMSQAKQLEPANTAGGDNARSITPTTGSGLSLLWYHWILPQVCLTPSLFAGLSNNIPYISYPWYSSTRANCVLWVKIHVNRLSGCFNTTRVPAPGRNDAVDRSFVVTLTLPKCPR